MENKETRDKTAEHHKQKVSVIISSTNTTGNEKRDSILELMVEAIGLSKIDFLQEKIWEIGDEINMRLDSEEPLTAQMVFDALNKELHDMKLLTQLKNGK